MVVILVTLVFGWLIRRVIGPDNTERIKNKLKYLIAKVYLRQLKKKSRPYFAHDVKSRDVDKVGVTSPADAWIKENPRELSSQLDSSDCFRIWGGDNEGNLLMVSVVRRHDRMSEAWLHLRTADGDRYELPHQPDTRVYNTDGKSFNVLGLTFDLLEPLRRWRINFNGVLRKIARNQNEENDAGVVTVRFDFIWHPMYNYAAFPHDFNINIFAHKLAAQNWSEISFKDVLRSPTEWSEQWGQLHGKVSIENNEELIMLLNGTKKREFGELNWRDHGKGLNIKGFASNAMAFHSYFESDNRENLSLRFAQIAPPSCLRLFSVDACKMTNQNAFFNKTTDCLNEEIFLEFTAENKLYNAKLLMDESTHGFHVFTGDDWNCRIDYKFVKIELNNKVGFAIIEKYEPHLKGCPLPANKSLPQLIEPSIVGEDRLILDFTDVSCQCSSVTGGKGASLALLSSLEPADSGFRVPSGICITVNSFHRFLEENPNIQQAISNLQQIAWTEKPGSTNEESKRVVSLILETNIPTNLKKELDGKLRKNYGDSYQDVQFAVRSSAIGEDSDELSAAGQNETFLGIKGLEMICNSVIKCWASQFAFRSIEYKRQNGQILDKGMAVVIQEMVPSELAGVLFSRDPITGNNSRMIITSNYGLGESVVSAAVEPDTVILNRAWDDEIYVKERIIGKKLLKIVTLNDGGTTEINVKNEESDKCSLGDEFSCRPVTISSDSVLTDFQILHEFDTPVKTPNERYSTGNVGEVMPGACCPLTITGTMRAHALIFVDDSNFKLDKFRFDPSIFDGFGIFYSHLFFDLVQGAYEVPEQTPVLKQQKAWGLEEKKSLMSKATEVGLYGKVLDDGDLKELARDRFKDMPNLGRFVFTKLFLPGLIGATRIMNRINRCYNNYPVVAYGAKSAVEAYKSISDDLMTMTKILMSHLHVTFGSVLYNAIVLMILSGGKDFELQHYADFAQLIGGGNGAESGDVPHSLKELSKVIADEKSPAEFSKMSPEDALEWIRFGAKRSFKKFIEFINRHGHRSFKEFDAFSISWGMNPILVIKMIQTMMKNDGNLRNTATEISVQEAISKLQTPIGGLKKRLLAFVVKKARNSVCLREQAKSLLIKYVNCCRLSYRHLAKMMVKEGYIPDEDLLFFLTFEEIEILLKTRSPKLIMRARRRFRLYEKMDSMEFPEICNGFPESINELKHVKIEGESCVKGYPVCQGSVTAPARVILSFDECDKIQKGDILITHATDIGWTPYFPMLSGVVTEIGGLVSHGAVVAREYGLPCIIGAENATRIFNSGDIVLLDSSKGVVAKVDDN